MKRLAYHGYNTASRQKHWIQPFWPGWGRWDANLMLVDGLKVWADCGTGLGVWVLNVSAWVSVHQLSGGLPLLNPLWHDSNTKYWLLLFNAFSYDPVIKGKHTLILIGPFSRASCCCVFTTVFKPDDDDADADAVILTSHTYSSLTLHDQFYGLS